MANLYNVDSPINREQRNNLNATFEDILRRFSNLQMQINVLSGETSVEDILVALNTAIDNANDTVAQLQQLVADDIIANDTATQNAINNLNNTLANQLDAIDVKMTEMQTAINSANTATSNATTATTNANTAITNAQNAVTAINNVIASMNYVGEYDTGTTYYKNNIVRYGKNSYASLIEQTGVTPNDDGSNWRIVALGGTDGTGAVSKVNGVEPNGDGDVILQPSDIGAAKNTDLIIISDSVNQLDDKVTQHLDDVALVGINIYVSNSGSDNNDGLTAETPILSNARLNELLNKYKNVNAIDVLVLNDIDRIIITNQNNIITVKSPSATNKSKCKITAYNCRDVRVVDIEAITAINENLLQFYSVSQVVVSNCKFQPLNGGIGGGIYMDSVANFKVDMCEGNYLNAFLSSYNSVGMAHLSSGAENVNGYVATYGSTISVLGNNLSATTLFSEAYGGEIRQ